MDQRQLHAKGLRTQLDAETKRRIDNARDTLVGKVTDPKGQVEQITIALTYKFMDDMDLEAVRLGGKRTFFAGNFEPYAWSKLMDPAVNAQHMHRLYSDGIERMSENPGAAPLFRTIFANAFLPYNDPQTLQQFLRIINEFEYGNSEALGDAYEYLTSIMGSQGDAGQFRTPRHIIDFIVDIVDPQIGETILDPACGTGGFLISAYKHILAANTDADGSQNLTPSQQAKLADSLTGYDIDPGMVRIALLNLYLHSLVDPHIFEYDTLTSEEHWNRYADVIVANPPFMTPKGGIRPHSKFSVQSKRSEVLFVDYMAEHLTTNGRAGIIVPEGIIFQTQNAHKQLRKMMVDDYLVAVISLPGGVFNPYSGVKTSILILDKALARKSASIGFFKVTNDGYDLGAQRRPIDKDDLPQVRADVQEYLSRARSGEPTSDSQPESGHVVPREKIAADGEYNLSGERYKVRTVRSAKWPMVRLGDVAEVIAGQSPPGTSYNEVGEGEPFHQGKTQFGETHIGEPVKWTTDPRRFAGPGDVIMSVRAPVGPVNLTNTKICIGRGLAAIRPDGSRLLTDFAFRVLRHAQDSITGSGGSAFDSISIKAVSQLELPLPPLDVQHEVIEEIETYQRVIDGARMVVANWRPRIEVDPAWPVVELGEVCEVNPKRAALKISNATTEVSFLPMADMTERTMYTTPMQTRTLGEVNGSYSYFADRDVLVARVTPCFENGKISIAAKPVNNIGFGSSEFHVLRCNGRVLPEWAYVCMTRSDFREAGIVNMTGTGGLQRVPRRFVESWQIPVPPIATQETLISKVASERKAVDSSQGLVAAMEARVRDAVARVWG